VYAETLKALLQSDCVKIVMSAFSRQLINSRILEASDRAIAYHITKVDWEALQRTPGESTDEEPVNNEEKRDRRIYEKLLHDPRFRWDMIIERSLTFSHFVTISILQAESKESMFSKWIGIANELKISMGNFLSFCNIMRGLICPKFNTVDNAIDWMKLRREFTNSTFQFETVLRNSYNQLQQGKWLINLNNVHFCYSLETLSTNIKELKRIHRTQRFQTFCQEC
jgi:hypothetical protein